MKKKVLLILAVFCITAVSQVYAIGIGVQGNYYLNFEKSEDAYSYNEPVTPKFGFSLLVSPSRQLHFSGNYYFSKTTHVIGLTGDYHPEAFTFKLFGSGMTLLSNPNAWRFSFGFGLGGFVNLWVTDLDEDKAIDNTEFSGGIRVPIGFNLHLANSLLEIFTNIAPSVGIRFGEATPFADWFFPVAIGVRLWFK